VTPATWSVIDLIADADNGHLPLAGGTLSQTQSFMDVRRFYNAEVSLIKAKQGK
jgi:hypothetical protein